MKVIKQDGSEMPFEEIRIHKAIEKADRAGRESGLNDSLSIEEIISVTEAVAADCERLHRAVNIEEI